MKHALSKRLPLWGFLASIAFSPVLVVASEDQPLDTPPTVSVQQLPEGFVNTADISMALDDEGTLSLAGVVGLDVDDMGRTIVEVRRNGDFELDPVLAFDLPLLTDSEGNALIGGFAKIAFRSDTIVITLDDQTVESGYLAAGESCHLAAKLPSMEVVCLGDCDDVALTCIFQTEIVAVRLIPAPDDRSSLPASGDEVASEETRMDCAAAAPVIAEVYITCGCVDLDP